MFSCRKRTVSCGLSGLDLAFDGVADFAGFFEGLRLGCRESWRDRLPSAKITKIKEFTPAAWAKAKVTEKLVAQAA